MKAKTSASGMQSMRTELQQNGWTIGELPLQILNLLKNEALSLINNSRTTVEVIRYVNSLSESEFRNEFSKERRFFSFPIASLVQDWARSLAGLLAAERLLISPVSNNEIRKNAKLRPGDKDLFFRCVRANQEDVAPAHYDAMFWDILDGTDACPEPLEPYDKRWKVWIPLFFCDRTNSLQVVSGSHNESIPVKYMESDRASYATQQGKIAKVPGIDDQWLQSNEQRFETPEGLTIGKFILFHDALVHRGPRNSDSESRPRISCEFTILAS